MLGLSIDDGGESKQCATRRNRSRFAQIQLCLFLGCLTMPMGSAAALSLRGRGTRRLQKQSEIFRNEPSYGQQSWIFEAIRLTYAWNMGVTGENVRVRINDKNIWGYGIAGDSWFENNNENYTYQFAGIDNSPCGSPWEKVNPSANTNTTNATTSVAAPSHRAAAAASIVSANGTNDYCGVGIAPSSTVSFCDSTEDTTSVKVDLHSLNETTNDTANENTNATITKTKPSFDISINTFAYQGCTAESRTIRGLYFPEIPTETNSSILDERDSQNQLTTCPFGYYSKDADYESPCKVCTKEDFEYISDTRSRDNVFTTASIKKEKHKTFSVSEKCASSVRLYCRKNFQNDKSLCTNWIDAMNSANVCSFESNIGMDLHQSLGKGANNGRDGKGVVYISSSGDTHGNGDNVNYQAFSKSRFVMTVGAVDIRNITGGKSGYFLQPDDSTYSTGGSSLFVVAPGGDYGSPYKFVGATDEGCGDIGYGTAHAASVVGGVVALMLEAYPNATWRDIRAIIAKTSKPVIVKELSGNYADATYGINSAKIGYSELFGFGIVNARGAVQKARVWKRKGKHAPPEVGMTETSGKVNLDIYDDSFSTTTSTITLFDERFENGIASVESVSVYLKLRYFNRGHLRITLRSPSGTTSVLTPGGRHEYGQLKCGEWWEFLTLRSWGENPNGTWKLSITDTKAGNGEASCIDRPEFSVPTDVTNFGFDMTCEGYEMEGLCAGGIIQKLQNETFNAILFEDGYGHCNVTASSACCACGGGIKADDEEVNSGQLEEWKIVLGDGGYPDIGIKTVNFYDEEVWNKDYLKFNKTAANTTTKKETIVTSPPTPAPTEAQKPPTLPPTIRSFTITGMPDPKEEINGFSRFLDGIKKFFSGLFEGGSKGDGDGDESDTDGIDGEETSKTASVVAWIITFGFSVLLLLRGSSLCDFHVNFLRENSRDRRDRQRFHVNFLRENSRDGRDRYRYRDRYRGRR